MVENGVPSAPTEGLPTGFLAPGQVLGDRYQIRSQLGRGGMGEVWRAFDLKLRVEVALKALLPDLFKDEKRRDMLRREVRAAREVVSPNVCRIFDLIEVDGRELVSMEYVDGGTLLGVLQDRGPLDLTEAQDIASQFLAGLEAIHQAGLVHRDVKPENIMITRAGRVVLMDFGIAQREDSGAGTVSGTPAYMAPEQAAGLEVDARADVYSAGVVLAEMVSPEGIKSFESRQSVWEGIREEPAKVPDSPWAPVLKKAVAKEPDQRHNSAHTLIRELEDVTLRVEGADEVTPYPGLAFFTEADAEYFYGREAEVEAMWRTLEQPHLLAIIGPSGSGKSSFLRAGLIPARPQGWSCVVATPGSSPLVELAQALVPEFAGDAEAIRDLVRTDDPDAMASAVARWRERHDQVVLVVDQFEELFTLNPLEVQSRYADLLSRLALENDVHVLLSMRDDFLFHCQAHEALRPVFSEITPLGPLVGGALRRALVQPASRCGYRFDDDDLVVEMLAEVEGERGSLPLLAFAVSRLWEERDRGEGLLTREAYQRIGGVGGALGRHAEDTLERIGEDREPMVREIFRNLVTAQGTRAVRDLGDLLSVFDEHKRDAANDVLRELVDARLLTTFETGGEDEETRRRVEIIHESLLVNWQPLVRWQTQDAEGVQFRDELRQAARTWDEHNRSDDLLWAGSAYREFAVWRERYPGGLSATEEAFSTAMTSLATRRRRRRRVAATGVVIFLATVSAALGSLWRRSVVEARRAEASKLIAQAQLRLEDDPTEALAYAISSLELADTEEARVFAVKSLSVGPPASVLTGGGMSGRAPYFSRDGRWLAAAGHHDEVLVWPDDGGEPIRLPGHTRTPQDSNTAAWTLSGHLVTGHWTDQRVRVWSIPEGKLLRTIEFHGPTRWQVGENSLYAKTGPGVHGGERGIWRLRRWKLPGGDPEDLGFMNAAVLGLTASVFDPSGPGLVYAKEKTIYYRPLPVRDGATDFVLGRHDNDAGVFRPRHVEPDRIWSRDRTTLEMRCWSLTEPSLKPLQVIPPPPDSVEGAFAVRNHSQHWLRFGTNRTSAPLLWDLGGFPGARLMRLSRNENWYGSRMAIHPDDCWLTASAENWDRLVFWPVERTYPSVVEGYTGLTHRVTFSPDGRWLATGWGDKRTRMWPLCSPEPQEPRIFDVRHTLLGNLVFNGTGETLASVGYGTEVYLIPVDGGPSKILEGFSDENLIYSAAFSPSGRLFSVGFGYGTTESKSLRVWDLNTDDVRVFDLEGLWAESEQGGQPQGPQTGWEDVVWTVVFADESTLYTAGWGGVRKWDIDTGISEAVIHSEPKVVLGMKMSDDLETVFTRSAKIDPEVLFGDSIVVHHLIEGTSRSLELFGGNIRAFDIDARGEVLASGTMSGIVRVGYIEAGEPHLLLGHDGPVVGVAISPDLEWVATAGQDQTLRLWPMPDLSRPPLHTLPREELIAKLKTLTNLRVVRDEESSTGWKVEVGPFPGWAEVPEW